ncbi:efflux RND transporter periplasmic adaptor subunit [Fulvivirgaceae bacterium BMA10]|uniref:Efflux RND transporter periplasmic adaptor subunit n=1 Tax=Splendidivirga corallicola TaxID=3051826 RepID=A0ABT8KWL8_9BACT|nr:efflux RND transporter periplasmic adaptor subunit [Fulvivirgaceae bacterium BMA10]
MKINKKNIILMSLMLVIGLALGWLIFGSGPHTNEATRPEDAHQHSETWTCSMHPQVRQPEPGNCPLCGMALIPLQEDTGSDDPTILTMTEKSVQLANIQTSIVGQGSKNKALLLAGKIIEDESRIYSQTAHFPGRIEKLFISFTGESIRKGQKIASIYSPELVTAQEELLEAKRFKPGNPTLVAAARAKLRLLKLHEPELRAIEESGKVKTEFDIRSDVSGIITKKSVSQGDHVMDGMELYEITDLSKVWVVLDAYENQLEWIKKGQTVKFTLQSLPGQTFQGDISFIDPVIDPNTRVAQVRIEVSNPEGKLKPGMFVNGNVLTRSEEESEAPMVPKSAVMWTGKRSIVYVKVANSNVPAFQLREITLGQNMGEFYQVIDGLETGEEVVSNGTFTVDAAAQLQGKKSMMNPLAEKVSLGHQHGQGHEASGSNAFTPIVIPDAPKEIGDIHATFKTQLTALVPNYIRLKDQLVESDGSKAVEAAQLLSVSMQEVNMELLQGSAHAYWTELLKIMQESIEKINKGNLTDQRLQFINLSNALIAAVTAFEAQSNDALYIQHCPMANDNQGADWISFDEDIKNPYFGDQMLTCGWVKEVLSE